MKPWTTITNHLSAIPFALTIALACGPISADDLRVKVGQGSQLEIRCDGSVAAVLENRTGEVKNLDPGVYILRVVEGASLYRAEPLLAGIVSSPLSAVTLIAPSALSNTSGNWVV